MHYLGFAMTTENGNTTRKPSRRKGCLIWVLVALALVVYSFWSMGEPGRRARRVHGAIQPGMAYREVQALLTGRHYCNFQVNTNGTWDMLSQEAFDGFLSSLPSNAPAPARLQLHFMGSTPMRVTFFVDLDSRGTVKNVTNPYGWD